MPIGGRIAIALAAASLAVVGLGSCISERQTVTAPVGGGDCQIPVSSTAPGTVIVFIRNFTFIPAQVSVKRGTKISWVNCEDKGLDAHSSVSDAGVWDSPTLQPSETYSRAFNDPAGNTFEYHCDQHPFMKGTVNVE
ncbi:MAG TPA: plastocyanin/azurin family copper-binding protein [Gemmatimonadaceae bacterium]|jgi:plastocyanin|nr:plastocyanin/azurin family copper-binding protein [Gemmatimonadaceae bacterium]